jgi:hypothetical protein
MAKNPTRLRRIKRAAAQAQAQRDLTLLVELIQPAPSRKPDYTYDTVFGAPSNASGHAAERGVRPQMISKAPNMPDEDISDEEKLKEYAARPSNVLIW